MTGASRRVAIVGIGATEFSKNSGCTEIHLAVDATRRALDDAGLGTGEVDGMVTYTIDSSPELEVARHLGIPQLAFFGRTPFGGGGLCATLQQAQMAIASGHANVVVCYRALNGYSGQRLGKSSPSAGPDTPPWSDWCARVGLNSLGMYAMVVRRVMHDYGWTSEDFGRVTVSARRHAATNPAAQFFERPISLEDHQSSRHVVEPLRALDCCQQSDGGVAFVVTSLDRARDLPHPPAVVAAVAQGAVNDHTLATSLLAGGDLASIPETSIVAHSLWKQSGLRPADMQTAVLYDHFTPFVLLQLEHFGFCATGEAPDFVASGGIDLGGALPVNTHGGQLGEAAIHGMNGICEAVRQVRGTAVNQVPSGIEHVLVSGAPGVPTTGAILARDR